MITHEYSPQLADGAQSEQPGILHHATLSELPHWRAVDEERTLTLKQLLQEFRLAYPADRSKMRPWSDLIVPSYWKWVRAKTRKPFLRDSSVITRHSLPSCKFEYCWAYELQADDSTLVFEQFAVESVAPGLERHVYSNTIKIKTEHSVIVASMETESIRTDTSSDFATICLQVAGSDQAGASEDLLFYVIALERVLLANSLECVLRYVKDTMNSKHEWETLKNELNPRGRVSSSYNALVASKPWLPRNLEFFVKEPWIDPSVLSDVLEQQQFIDRLESRMKSGVDEIITKTKVLENLLKSPDTKRRYPSLWNLTCTANEVELRFLSD